ncbi:hypothetical protein niasHT_031643 [Heterodera trifolii]|uniref:Uncharacterized protein n=1 Tax=Heterodera trifolii TaxID=157864 RepID=A0ABD2J5R4_9BILA
MSAADYHPHKIVDEKALKLFTDLNKRCAELQRILAVEKFQPMPVPSKAAADECRPPGPENIPLPTQFCIFVPFQSNRPSSNMDRKLEEVNDGINAPNDGC